MPTITTRKPPKEKTQTVLADDGGKKPVPPSALSNLELAATARVVGFTAGLGSVITHES